MFPIILSSLFALVMDNGMDGDKFETIPIALIDSAYYAKDELLQKTLKSVKSGDEKLFDVTVVSKEKAKKLLHDSKVSAIVEDGENIKVTIYANGMKQTITQTFFDEYLQKKEMIMDIGKQGISEKQLQDILQVSENYLADNERVNSNPYSIAFFSVLGMSALFGGYWAIESMRLLQANQSSCGIRIGVSPTHKARLLLVDFLMNIAFQMVFLFIQLFYMIQVLGVDFGTHIVAVFMLLTCGTFVGIGIGTLIGNSFQKHRDVKPGILTTFTLLCSFLSGMMMIDMKYIIQTHVPILNMINPISMITDGLYSLYYYGITERFYTNIISLIAFTALCYIISYFSVRKRSFVSLEVK